MNKYSPFPGDTVPAMLEEGEYVLNRNAVNAIGKEQLDYLNHEAEPRFAQEGDYIKPKYKRRVVGDRAFVHNPDTGEWQDERLTQNIGPMPVLKRTPMGGSMVDLNQLRLSQNIGPMPTLKRPPKNTTMIDLHAMKEVPTNPEFNVDDWNGLVGGMSENMRHWASAYDTQQRHILNTKRKWWQKKVPLQPSEISRIERGNALMDAHKKQDAEIKLAMASKARNEAMARAKQQHETTVIQRDLEHRGWQQSREDGPPLPPAPKKPINPATGRPYDTIEVHEDKLRQVEEAGKAAYHKRRAQLKAAKEFKKEMRGKRAAHFEKERGPLSPLDIKRAASDLEPDMSMKEVPKVRPRPKVHPRDKDGWNVDVTGHAITNALKGIKGSRGNRYEYQTGDLVSRTGVDLSGGIEVDEYGNPIDPSTLPAAWLQPAGSDSVQTVSPQDQALFDMPDYGDVQGPPQALDYSTDKIVPSDAYLDEVRELTDPHNPDEWQEKPGQYPISYDEAEGGGQEQREARELDDLEQSLLDKTMPKATPQVDLLNKKTVYDSDDLPYDESTLKTHPRDPSHSMVLSGLPDNLKKKVEGSLDPSTWSQFKGPNIEKIAGQSGISKDGGKTWNPASMAVDPNDNWQRGMRTLGGAKDWLSRAKAKAQGTIERYMGTQAGRNFAAESKLAAEDPNWESKSQAEKQQAVIDYRNNNWKEYKEGDYDSTTGIRGEKTGVQIGSGLGNLAEDAVSGLGAVVKGAPKVASSIYEGAKTGLLGAAGLAGAGIGAGWKAINEGKSDNYRDVWSGKEKGSMLQRGRKGLGALSMTLKDASMAQGFSGADWAGSGYNQYGKVNPLYSPLGVDDTDVPETPDLNLEDLNLEQPELPRTQQTGGMISYLSGGGAAKKNDPLGLYDDRSGSTVGVQNQHAIMLQKLKDIQLEKQYRDLLKNRVSPKTYKRHLRSRMKDGDLMTPEQQMEVIRYFAKHRGMIQ